MENQVKWKFFLSCGLMESTEIFCCSNKFLAFVCYHELQNNNQNFLLTIMYNEWFCSYDGRKLLYIFQLEAKDLLNYKIDFESINWIED